MFRKQGQDMIVTQKEFKDNGMEIVEKDEWNDETKQYEKQRYIKQGETYTEYWDHPLVQQKWKEFGLGETAFKNLPSWGVPHYIATELQGLTLAEQQKKFYDDFVSANFQVTLEDLKNLIIVILKKLEEVEKVRVKVKMEKIKFLCLYL